MIMPTRSHVRERPLTGHRIVVTRPLDDAARLADRLRALGAEPIIVPVIRAEFTDPPELETALQRVSDFDWIVFTSRNGVEAVFRLVTSIAGPRIAAIGPATRAALERHGLRADLMPETYVAEGVIAALGDVNGLSILLPRADIARAVLADGLVQRGARVTQVAAYRTVTLECDPAVWVGADTVTFTSASTVHGLLASGPIPEGATVVCIGPITAAAAREHGLVVTAVAQEYTEDGLVDALTAALGKRRPEGDR